MPVDLTTDTPLEPGNTLQICGIIPKDARVLDVGLGSGWNDLSFCMIIRFHNNVVGFKTRENGQWGQETTHPHPYQQGGKFEVTVDYTKQNFVVTMEGKTLTIPNCLNTVKTEQILVKGDLELHHLTLNPQAVPGITVCPGVKVNNKLQMSGIITQDAHHIEVGLGSGSDDWSLHAAFCFRNKVVVFNTKKDGTWGAEITHPNPYQQGGKFEVTVDCAEDNYVVTMEGKTVTIPNRLKTVKTKQIMLKGDLELQGFTLEPQAVNLIPDTTVDRDNKLQISGNITQDAQNIEVGLGSGSDDWSFYVDFRFDNHTVVFNTRECGIWGQEITHPHPYQQGGAFEVTVKYSECNYEVMMEGKELTIPNRLNTVKTQQILVKGDLDLQIFTLKPSN